MIDAIPLVTEYNKSKLIGHSKNKVPDPRMIQAALWIQYCHALRVSEVINLTAQDFNLERNILTLHNTKTGKGKKQFTSITPDFPDWTLMWLPLKLNRQLLWSYVKKACKMAGLDMVEQQKERLIEGAWTHLIRKSRAKYMIELWAPVVMVKVKLRHTFTVTDEYIKPDINALIKWELENINGNY